MTSSTVLVCRIAVLILYESEIYEKLCYENGYGEFCRSSSYEYIFLNIFDLVCNEITNTVLYISEAQPVCPETMVFFV